MNAEAEDGFIRTLIKRAEDNSEAYLDAVPRRARIAAQGVADRPSGVGHCQRGSRHQRLARRMYTEAHQWADEVETAGSPGRRDRGGAARAGAARATARQPPTTTSRPSARRKAALRLTRRQLADLRGEYWIGVLEEHGILPNYTLLDDWSTLDVAFSWVDPDTGEYETEPQTFNRGAAAGAARLRARRDLLRQRTQIRIDAIDLGTRRRGGADLGVLPGLRLRRGPGRAASPAAARAAAAHAIADVEQRFDVVELTGSPRRCAAKKPSIDDSRDDAYASSFTVVAAADIDPGVVDQWFVDGYGFGVRAPARHDDPLAQPRQGRRPGQPRSSPATSTPPPLFRVCSSCGQLDTVDPHEPRHPSTGPGARTARAADESTTHVALSRTLRTEGLVVRLPPR